MAQIINFQDLLSIIGEEKDADGSYDFGKMIRKFQASNYEKSGLTHKQFLNKYLPKEIKEEVIKSALITKNLKCDIATSSSNVVMKKLKKNHRNFITIKIDPIGWQQCCYQNSYNTCMYDENYGICKGYQLTVCPCGSVCCLEPHFCNTRTIDGETRYYDFTKDYHKEEYRLFLPIENITDEDETPNSIQFLLTPTIVYGKDKCKCAIDWL